MATDLLTADPLATKTRATEPKLSVGTYPGVQRIDDDIARDAATVGSNSADKNGAGQGGAVKARVRDLVTLTKPRIVTMILVTTTATAMIGAGGTVGVVSLAWLLLGTALVAGSAGSANQVWERVIDQNMTRTASRPLPAGRISTSMAVVYTALIGMMGTAILWLGFGPSPAIAGLITWAIYVLLYTPMKTRTSFNTTVGAIAGALPVLIGYTACGGTFADATGWLLVGVLVAWQYPHFMAIAWLYRHQYDEAGFKMSTTVEPTGFSAAMQSIVGSIALIGCGVALCFGPDASWLAWVASVLVTAATYPMLKASLRFYQCRDDVHARKLLRSSLLVLPIALLIVTLRVFW